MTKLKLREAENIGPDHTASRWQYSAPLTPKASFLLQPQATSARPIILHLVIKCSAKSHLSIVGYSILVIVNRTCKAVREDSVLRDAELQSDLFPKHDPAGSLNTEAVIQQEILLPLTRNREERKIVLKPFLELISKMSGTDGLAALEKLLFYRSVSLIINWMLLWQKLVSWLENSLVMFSAFYLGNWTVCFWLWPVSFPLCHLRLHALELDFLNTLKKQV